MKCFTYCRRLHSISVHVSMLYGLLLYTKHGCNLHYTAASIFSVLPFIYIWNCWIVLLSMGIFYTWDVGVKVFDFSATILNNSWAVCRTRNWIGFEDIYGRQKTRNLILWDMNNVSFLHDKVAWRFCSPCASYKITLDILCV